MAGRLTVCIALALVVGGAVIAWRSQERADAATPAAAPPPSVPVTVSSVRNSDVAVRLTGLATVQPLNVVTVRSRVDGQVMKIGFEEGQMVREGDLLAEIDGRPYRAALDQAKAKQAQDEAQLANAERDLARYAQLAANNYASRQQLDSQKAQVAQLKATIDGDKAAVESAELQLDYATIRAPMAGRAGFRLVDVGNLVRATDATGIVTLSQIAPITALVTLPERDFAEVTRAMKIGDTAAVALSPEGRELSQGKLSVINSQIDQATGTFKVKATFQNGDGALWPGQSISVRVTVDTLKNVVTAPEPALQRGPDGYFAFVAKDGSTVERRKITVQRQADGVAVISQGLQPGEIVVTGGASRLSDGTRIAPSDRAAESAEAR